MSGSKVEQPNNQDGEGKEGGQRSQHPPRASAAALINAFANQYAADRQENKTREAHRIFREWLTIIGLFLAAGAAFFQWRELRSTDHSVSEQARVSGEQLKVMQGQLTEMKSSGEQTAKLIAANEKLADATVAGLGRNLRAKVSIPNAELESFEIGAIPNAIVQIENTGHGTANGKMRGIVRIAPVTEKDFSIDRTLAASVTAHPGSKISRPIRGANRITEQQMQAVMTGKSAIFVYGDYRFTDESKAVTLCTYRLFYQGGSASVPGIGGPWVPVPISTSKPPVLRQTGGYNNCSEEKPAPRKSPN